MQQLPSDRDILAEALNLTQSYGLAKGGYAANETGLIQHSSRALRAPLEDMPRLCAFCTVGFIGRAMQNLGLSPGPLNIDAFELANRTLSPIVKMAPSVWSDHPATTLTDLQDVLKKAIAA